MPNPFAQPGEWLKGNLHAHTTNSDGWMSPQYTVRAYAAMDYDFLALTDHMLFTDPRELDPCGLTLVRGAEVDAPVGPIGQSLHVVALGLDQVPQWPEGASAPEFMAAVAAQCMACFAAHPSWSLLEGADLLPLEGYLGVEVYNQICDHMGRGYSELQWDALLARGRTRWGLAVDDCHFPQSIGRGWIVLRSAQRSEAAILAALRAGHFYATRGPLLEGLSLEGDKLRVACSPCREAAVLSAAEGSGWTTGIVPHLRRPFTQVALPIQNREAWLRVELWDERGRKAWSNPFHLDEL